jgi:hypothetical protein
LGPIVHNYNLLLAFGQIFFLDWFLFLFDFGELIIAALFLGHCGVEIPNCDGRCHWVVVASDSTVRVEGVLFAFVKIFLHHFKTVGVDPEGSIGIKVIHQVPVDDYVLASSVKLNRNIVDGDIKLNEVVNVIDADSGSCTHFLCFVHLQKAGLVENRIVIPLALWHSAVGKEPTIINGAV